MSADRSGFMDWKISSQTELFKILPVIIRIMLKYTYRNKFAGRSAFFQYMFCLKLL